MVPTPRQVTARRWFALSSGLVILLTSSVHGITFTTNTTISAGNLSYEGQPIVVDACTVTIDGTHSFESLHVVNNGIVTHTAGQADGVQLTIAQDVTVAAGSRIDLGGKGPAGGNGTRPGQSEYSSGGGGGFGGVGGVASSAAAGGVCYGSLIEPADLGSGGGASYGHGHSGGAGGGRLKLAITGTLAVEGTIHANGSAGAGDRGGGGSGGSLWIIANTIAGSGTIQANGGAGHSYGGGGGGGRIALNAETNSFTGTIGAQGGSGHQYGGAGTIYRKLTGEPRGQLLIDNGGSTGGLTRLNADFWTGTQPFNLRIANGGLVWPEAALTFHDVTIAVGGAFSHEAGQTVFDVTAEGDFNIETDGLISADAKGHATASGPGVGGTEYSTGGGGGYGGVGGNGSTITGGLPYGSLIEPVDLGSGGGSSSGYGHAGGAGGGRLKLTIAGLLTVDGTISANGKAGSGDRGGGGSGGSIWIIANAIAGAGAIQAHGGAGHSYGGGGSGGRIAVHAGSDSFTGTTTAYGGSGSQHGGAGTIYTRLIAAPQGQLVIDNGGKTGGLTRLNPAFWTGAEPFNLRVANGGLVWPETSVTFHDVTVAAGGTLSHEAGLAVFDVTAQGDFNIAIDGRISANDKGYSGTNGPGAGTTEYTSAGGGGYGGVGGASSSGAPGGLPYASLIEPVDLGSGGGMSTGHGHAGGAGGGRLRLQVSGTLAVDGTIAADGNAGGGDRGGGGAGGSIWITAATISGSGSIHAHGGGGHSYGGGGSGGRIAIHVDTNAFAGSASASGGSGDQAGGAGTVFVKVATDDQGLLTIDNDGKTGGLTRLNTAFWAGAEPFNLRVANGALVWPDTPLVFHHVVVAAAGTLSHQSANTVFDITAQGDLTVETDGQISADAKGYPATSGSGTGGTEYHSGGGGGYGGVGGNGYTSTGGSPYGSLVEPADLGSGGGSSSGYGHPGGAGGGKLKLTIDGLLTVDGTISANGKAGSGDRGGGGSGGSIWIIANTITGAGAIQAHGGAGHSYGGGGSGGRIAVHTGTDSFTGTTTAYGGSGSQYGGAGTIYTRLIAAPQGQLVIDNGGNTGGLTRLDTAFWSGSDPFNVSIANGALVWPSTSLRFHHVVVAAGGTLSHEATRTVFDVVAEGDLSVEAGGVISADGKGFGQTAGPGAGAIEFSSGGAAGYGGVGGNAYSTIGGLPYGSLLEPTDLGSGGGSAPGYGDPGGAGGGKLKLTVNGVILVDGTISANGASGSGARGGGGSGGSVWITADEMAGTGTIRANGGAGTSYGGGGSGGRIAVYVNGNDFNGALVAYGASGYARGGAGTIYTRVTSDTYGTVRIDNGGNANGLTRLNATQWPQDVLFDLDIGGAALVYPDDAATFVNLTLNTGAVFSHAAGVDTFDVTVLQDLTVGATATIRADRQGRASASGPGAGQTEFSSGGGAGYGGAGGNGSSSTGGGTYGSQTEPVDLGSGGGTSTGYGDPGGPGGGKLKLVIGDTLNLDGSITAAGGSGTSSRGGGGSGGSVWISTGTLSGAGTITANGGTGTSYGGGGGGGRIAVYYYDISGFNPDNIVAAGGAGRNDGSPGTIHVATGTEPTLDPIADATIPEGATYTGSRPQVSAGIPPFAFSLLASPAGMTIDPLTGIVTWPAATAVGSPHTVTIQVENPFGTDSRSYQLTVEAAAPVIASIEDDTITVGSAYVGPVPALLQGSPPIIWSLVEPVPAGMQIDAGTGVVTWPNPTVAGGPQTVTIRATNDQGSDDESWQLTVRAAPIIAEIEDHSAAEGATYTSPTPSLVQGWPAPAWSLVPPYPEGMTIHASTGVVTWPGANSAGSPYPITIEAANVAGSDQESWLLTVELVPPEIVPGIPSQTVAVGTPFTGPTPVLRQGSPPVTWSLVDPAPAGMTIDSATGVVSWPAPVADGSPYTIVLRASNSLGSDEVDFTLLVLYPPAIEPIEDHSVADGSPYTGPTPILTQGSPPVSWALVAPAPAGMTINPGTGAVSWAKAVLDGSPYTITIRASNVVGQADVSWQLTVTPVPPVITDVAGATIAEGVQYTRAMTLQQGSAPLTWSLLAGPDGMDINTTTGLITWPMPIMTGSPFTVIVHVANIAGEDDATFTLTVGRPPIIAEIPDAGPIDEGVTYVGPTPTLVQGSAPVAWSLAAGPAGMTIDAATGVVTWPTPLGRSAPYDVTIVATNSVGTDTERWTLNVPITYTATVEAGLDLAPAGTSVSLTGQAIRLDDGQPKPNVPVTIRIRLKGTRRLIDVMADESGKFAAVFEPIPNEAGFYQIGADHPAMSIDPIQDSFTLVGMKMQPATVSHQLLTGKPVTGTVALKNLGDTALSGLVITNDAPANLTFDLTTPPTGLAASGQATLAYTLTASDDSVANASVHVDAVSAEGATARLTLQVSVRPPVPQLTAAPTALSAGMVRGRQQFVQFSVSNTGGAATSSLQVQIPATPWLSVASPVTMNPLQPGERATVVLALAPAEDLDLGPYDGTVNVVGTSTFVTLPFQFIALSDGVGDLRVTAVDEYTYWAAGAPNLTGAEVTVANTVDGSVVAAGVTDETGSVLFSGLTEAYYTVTVTAVDHGSYRNSFLVEAGKTRNVTAFLTRELVKYVWKVVPTEIEDRYEVVIETVFETQVPAPVVTVEPTLIDLNQITEGSMQLDVTVTNHGLIAADDVEIVFEDHPRFRFEPLIREIGTLAANSKVVVPMTITDTEYQPPAPAGGVEAAAPAPPEPGPTGDPCIEIKSGVLHSLECGPDRHWHWKAIKILYPEYVCPHDVPRPPSFRWLGGGGGHAPGGGGGGGGGGTSPASPHVNHSYIITEPVCDPCADRTGKAVFWCLVNFLPLNCPGSIIMGAYQCISSAVKTGASWDTVHTCATAYLGGVASCVEEVSPLGVVINIIDCLRGIFTACDGLPTGPSPGGGAAPSPALSEALTRYNQLTGQDLPVEFDGAGDYQSAVAYLQIHVERLEKLVAPLVELFGDDIWFRGAEGDGPVFAAWLQAFQEAVAGSTPAEAMISDTERDELLALARPAQITEAHILTLIERWNRTQDYWSRGIFSMADVPSGEGDDFLALDVWEPMLAEASEAVLANEAEGHVGLFDGIDAGMTALQESLSDSDAVCARVRIEVKQEAVITRDAFEASLELDNASADMSIENVLVTLSIRRDEDNSQAEDVFVVFEPVLEGLSDVSGGGSVSPGSTGRASWLLVPTDEAAPDAETTYLVGGELSYVMNGALVTVPLFPDTISVRPNPSLHLKYFHQRDVYSDDPFTPEIEPAEPFSLGLLLTNTGLGTAYNVRITSAQPRIIENEKGLLIDFKIIGTQVGSGAVSPSLMVDLGDVGPDQTAVARWLLTASLQGTFVDYQATFEHIDGLGDPRLSLIDSVAIHELIHVVRLDHVADDGLPDFLVNDQVDPDDLPDTIHGSDNTLWSVTAVTEGTVDGPPGNGDLEVQLTASLPAGWAYLRIDDPGDARYRLSRVVRSDGREVKVDDNAWLTSRILRSGDHAGEPEYLLHLLDHDSTGHYTLIYTVRWVADLNADGYVTGVDFALFLAARGHAQGEPGYNSAADLDGDGVVTFVDQQLWLASYRESVGDLEADAPAPVAPSAYYGDYDGDNDVDMTDFGILQRCMTGENAGVKEAGCVDIRLDGDSDLDEADVSRFLECLGGANVTPAESCRR